MFLSSEVLEVPGVFVTGVWKVWEESYRTFLAAPDNKGHPNALIGAPKQCSWDLLHGSLCESARTLFLVPTPNPGPEAWTWYPQRQTALDQEPDLTP